MGRTPLNVCCIAQKGRFEVQAMILVASLQGKLPPETRMIVGYPEPESYFGKPDSRTTDFLGEHGVEILHFENPLIAKYGDSRTYQMLHANKIFLLEVMADRCEKILFLDSDQIAYEPLKDLPWDIMQLGLRSAGWSHWVHAAPFQHQIHEIAGVSMPLRSSLKRHPSDPAQYCIVIDDVETSFIAVTSETVKRMSRKWVAIFEKAGSTAAKDLYHLEELACSTAIRSLSIPYVELSSPLDTIVHYTWMPNLTNNHAAVAELRSIVGKYPYIRRRAAELDCCRFIEELCFAC